MYLNTRVVADLQFSFATKQQRNSQRICRSFASGPWEPRISVERRCRSLITPGKTAKTAGGAGTRSPDRRCYRRTEILGTGVAAEVGGAGAAFGENFSDGALDGQGRCALAEMV